MDQNVIFHNPRCSKSRATLELLLQKKINLEVREYLKSPPSELELKFICRGLGLSPKGLVRDKDRVFSELGLSLDDQRSDSEWIKILRENPALIERPIVVLNKKVAVGRPPENVLKILS